QAGGGNGMARFITEWGVDDARAARGDVAVRVRHVIEHPALRHPPLENVREVINRENLGIEGDSLNSCSVSHARRSDGDRLSMLLGFRALAWRQLCFVQGDHLRIGP